MSVEDAHSEFISLLIRHLSGELTTADESLFKQMILQDPAKQSLVEDYRKIWESVGSVDQKATYDLDAEWDLLKRKLPGESASIERTLVPERGTGASRSLLYYTYRIAAVLVVGLILTFAWIYGSRMVGTELVIAESEPVEVLLDDGTEVTVNRHSRIRYKKRFSTAERKVYLTGEAWFDVTRDTLRPFLIDAGTALVEVLGTSFNVNAYRENALVEITVESGVVAMTAKQDQQEQIVLRAGNSGTYNKKKKELTLIPTSNPNNLSWRTRELYFDHTSLQEVADLIGRVYNARLVIINRELAMCPITVTFKDQSLEAILKVLASTLDLEITKSGDEFRLDGPGCAE